MMTREELLKSPEYWISKIQIDLYNCAEKFMSKNHKNRTQLAKHLGVTKGYVSQLLNGDYDHKVSKFVELSLAFGYVPEVCFTPINEYVKEETVYYPQNRWDAGRYESSMQEEVVSNYNDSYIAIEKMDTKEKEAA